MGSIRFGAAVSVLAFAGLAAAQTDILYVTDGDSQRLARAQGGALLGTTSTHQGAYPIAVSGSAWIGQYYGDSTSREYDLNGVATGNSAGISIIQAVDGTTDGVQYNYQFGNAFNNGGQVYRSGLDFSNPTPIFSVDNMVRNVGITFDPTDQTLWVSGNSEVRQYDLAGNLMFGFNHQSGEGCLAYETSSDTLWFVRNGQDWIDQYSKSGTLLQSVNVPGLASNNWGAEFGVRIPAPGAVALLGLGGLIAGRRQR
jgi:hypothetical protein